MNKIETLQPDRVKQQVHLGNSPLVLDLPKEERTEELVDVILNRVFERLVVQEKEAFWSNALNEYNNFPKQTSRERKHAKNLVTKAAWKLLENPQDINIAEAAWRRHEEGQNHTEESKDSFPSLVKRECLALIKDKWQGVKPEQLAQLVRISVDNDDPSQDYAKEMLTSHFKGPKSKREGVDAYYNFVSATLDLVEDDKAFNEALKISFHATDILPRDPNLIEQSVLLSLPYGEDEKVFQKLLIAKYVINRVGLMSSQEIMKYHQENSRFINTNDKAKREWSRKREIATRKIGSDSAREFNDRMMGFFDLLQRPISLETKQSLKDTWPYSVAFDETDPLNQKFQKVFFDQLSSNPQVSPEQSQV